MTTRKKMTTGKTKVKRLKLKKEIIKDLDVKGRRMEVKGASRTCAACPTFNNCKAL